jgi:hypothetical protein
MEKKIGYELIVRNVRGFDDARSKMHDLIREGIVKCGQCDQAATSIFFQDQAEFYIRCPSHPEHGPQWTGSTRWNPSSFSVNVLKDKAEEWLSNLSFDDRKRYKLESYDATDYYDLIEDGKQASRHYLKGSDHESGMKIYAHIWPLTSGEYAYEISREWPRSKWTYGIVGAWPTETDALEAAKADAAVGS